MERLIEFFRRQTRSRIWLLSTSVVLLLSATTVAALWVAGPRYGALFGGLEQADEADIVDALREWKVPYRFSADGSTIEVDADQVHELRMRLVSAGIPRGGHVGFELFDEADFGVTEFAQRINFQRALQGEIERTISALPGVQRARVHLTIRRSGLLVGDKEQSKASVAVTLAPGATLNARQVGGIRHLVASAVEGLAPEAVSIVGSDGSLLGQSFDDSDPSIESDGTAERVRQRVLQALRGRDAWGDVTVTVAADVNHDRVTVVSERPLPLPDQVHGVLVRRSVSHGGHEGAQSQTQEQLEYAHGTEREEIARAPGQVRRLSIAVALPVALDEHELADVRRLVAAAAGLDPTRGDNLEIVAEPIAVAPSALPVDRPESQRPAIVVEAKHAAAMSWRDKSRLAAGVSLLIGGAALGFWSARFGDRRRRRHHRSAAVEQIHRWLDDVP